jgi:drug/metabolite transporter (DMT)-like permease
VPAALLALAASISWGVADFLGGIKSRSLPVLTVLAGAQVFGLLATAIVVAASASTPGGAAVLWAAPAAVLGTAGIAAFYRGMAIGSMSIVAPVAATGAAIPVVYGVARGDDPSALQVLGFVLAIGGAALASREASDELGRARLAAGVPWAVLAAVGFGSYFVPMHVASEEDFLWATLVFRSTGAVIVVALFLALRPQARLGRGDVLALALLGVLDSAGNGLFAAAASQGVVSVVSVLASLYPITTVALAWVYLRERVHALQAVGVAGALAGVVLVSGG